MITVEIFKNIKVSVDTLHRFSTTVAAIFVFVYIVLVYFVFRAVHMTENVSTFNAW